MYAHCPLPAPILLLLLKVATSYIRITLLKICSSFSENFRIMLGLISSSAREYLLCGNSELHDDTETFPKDYCLLYFSQ